MVDSDVTSYLNTVILCLLAKFLTLVIMAILLFIPRCPYKYFLLTMEIGLVTIVMVSLFNISATETKNKKELNAFLSSPFTIRACPNYFVHESDGVETVCLNEYTTPDSKRTYTFGSSPINLVDVIPNDSTMIADICKTMVSYANVAWTDITGKCALVA